MNGIGLRLGKGIGARSRIIWAFQNAAEKILFMYNTVN